MPKTPIDPADIRKGDLIRYERGPGYVHADVAHEYVAESDGDRNGYSYARYYLLDRPKPPVDLPADPTLGWLTRRGFFATPILDHWSRDGEYVQRRAGDRVKSMPIQSVVSFTPATAVPTEALESLRVAVLNQQAGIADRIAHTAFCVLEATDEANA